MVAPLASTGNPSAPFDPRPGLATLPDPLIAANGTPITTPEQWHELRRPEILELFRTHVYGRNSVERPASLSFAQEGAVEALDDGRCLRRTMRVSYTGPLGSGAFPLSVYTASGVRPKGVFVFICTRKRADVTDAETNGYFAKDVIVSRGYAAVGFFCGDLAADDATSLDTGVFGVFGPRGSAGRPADAWGAIAAWAWGASRAIDWVKSDPELSGVPLAVAGHSRGGKAALWCGAQDERVDLTISNSSGSTGAALARTKGGETIEQINATFPYWFCANYHGFAKRESRLPVDQHMLLALIAPRRVYVQSSADDAWADPAAEYESCLRAGPVFALLGQQPVGAPARPDANTPLHTGSIGYHLRGVPHNPKHNLTPYDWERFIDYMDRHLAAT